MPDKLPSYILPSFLSIFTVGANSVLAKNFASALTFIKEQEGLRLNAYQDTGGKWTIGWGSTWNFDKAREVVQGDTIDKETAQRWLEMETSTIAKTIRNLVKVSININQLNALISLTYNIGPTGFKNSTLLKLLNSGTSKIVVADQFLRWSYDDGIYSTSLNNRRKRERELFLK
jgi:lysozyme